MRPLFVSLFLLLSACAHSPAAPASSSPAEPSLPFMEPPAAPQPGWLEAHRANALLDQERYADALPLFRAAWAAGDRKEDNAYSAACAAARLGLPEEAMTWLERAVDAGYRDADWIAQDEDLTSLRALPAFIALRDRLPTLPIPREEGANPELQRLVDEDQADRQIPWDSKEVGLRIHERDKQRRAQVDRLLAVGAAKTGSDFHAAALVYQHGDTLADYARARELAAESARRGHPKGLRLTALAWDRWLIKAGKPQRFGSQYEGALNSTELRLSPMDLSVSDEERARWGFPPLAEISPTLK